MAGLVAAYELRRQGHEPVVLGGAEPRRWPRLHAARVCAGALCRGRRDAHPARAQPYAGVLPPLRAAAAAVRDGQPEGPGLHRRRAHDLPPRRTPARNGCPSSWRNTSAARAPTSCGRTRRPTSARWSRRAGDDAWAEIVRRYDEYSLYEFLKFRGFSEGAIEYYAVMNFVEADMHNAVIEILREDLGRRVRRHEHDRRRHGPAAERVLRRAAGRGPVRRRGARHRAGRRGRDAALPARHRTASTFKADYAICTLPFSVLRTVEHSFSHDKERAIRQLNYHASTKILFQVRHRFWEETDGIVGGATVTDLPIRRMNYPPTDPTTTRGVLLASYTWGQDALQWGAMAHETRIDEALEDVERIHPHVRERVRGGRVARLVRRPLGARRLRHVRARTADRTPGGHRRARGPRLLRRRALLAVPRLDPGGAESGIRAAREINELSAPQ